MSLKEGKAEIILGAFFTVLGILFLAVIIPDQIKYVEGAYPQPRFFPNLICALMSVLGISLFVGGLKKKKIDADDQEVYSLTWKEGKLVLITLGILAVYILAMEWIPYLPATIIVTGALVAIYGQKSKLKIILTAVLLPTIIYVGMTYGLMIKLP